MSKAITILVTGVGAVIGYGIVRSLRQSRHELKIIGMDIYADAYGRYQVDEFVKAERADSDRYGDFINNIVERYDIDLIIPGIEQDLYALNRYHGGLPNRVKVVMNSDLCVRLSANKFSTYEYFKDKGLTVIPTLTGVGFGTCVAELSLPFLIKPVSGYASKGIHVISTAEQFEFYTNQLEGNCIYQKIVGSMESEYTISVFGDGKGGFFDFIILKRQLSLEGATSKAELVGSDRIIEDYIMQICRLTKPLGPTNIQLRKEKGIPYLLEINPRISSACSIRTLMGYNEPEMCIDYFLLGRDPVALPKRQANVIRFIDDFVIYG